MQINTWRHVWSVLLRKGENVLKQVCFSCECSWESNQRSKDLLNVCMILQVFEKLWLFFHLSYIPNHQQPILYILDWLTYGLKPLSHQCGVLTAFPQRLKRVDRRGAPCANASNAVQTLCKRLERAMLRRLFWAMQLGVSTAC